LSEALLTRGRSALRELASGCDGEPTMNGLLSSRGRLLLIRALLNLLQVIRCARAILWRAGRGGAGLCGGGDCGAVGRRPFGCMHCGRRGDRRAIRCGQIQHACGRSSPQRADRRSRRCSGEGGCIDTTPLHFHADLTSAEEEHQCPPLALGVQHLARVERSHLAHCRELKELALTQTTGAEE
jgi:hypothetical protein